MRHCSRNIRILPRRRVGPAHPVQYEEWSVSPHAYAQLSPVFDAMNATLIKLTNGSEGDFCIRCHTPVGMNLGEPVIMSNLDRHPTSREGVTCVVCHRRKQPYGKISGRLGLVEGDIFESVFGPNGNEELRRVIESGEYAINTERGRTGRAIHTNARKLDQMSTSGFCGSCHDVNTVDGFRLEEAFSEFKSSPAAKKGVSCQDCHMGRDPGVPAGYAEGPAAIVGGEPTRPRKHANHMFVGPDYSIIHPGLYPHNPSAQQLASLSEWLVFDHEAGWGTDAFEDYLPNGFAFPERWSSIADRYEAREILNENLVLLEKSAVQRKKLLREGYQLGRIVVDRADPDEIRFRVEVKNGTEGHNVPTGFDAERVVFLRVTVSDLNGKVVYVSGDLDPNGDLRDLHSVYVHNGELPLDKHLFSLQSKFLLNMIRGGEREQVLPVNYSQDPLPFERPSTSSSLLLGRPRGARKHRRTIGPLGSTWAKYKVTASQLAGTEGPYKANIKMTAGMIPVNLVHAIQGVGFDYGMLPRKVADAVVAGHQTLWERDVVLQPEAIDYDGKQIAKE
jgi:nitrate/TMAO reductase-like tetraheme cytochrome c subunit